MKSLVIAIAFLCFGSLEACVTYDPSTGTYTVDKSGAVDIASECYDTEE